MVRLSQDKTIRGYFESKIGVGCGYVPFAITATIKNHVAYRTSKSLDLKIAIRRIGIGEYGRCHIRWG